MSEAMKICVIGTGYVGLVAGAGFADMGNDVVCCDIDAAKIEGLKSGVMPIYEPGLDKLVMQQRRGGAADVHDRRRRQASPAPRSILLAVGTPPGPDGSADLSVHLQGRRAGRRARSPAGR